MRAPIDDRGTPVMKGLYAERAADRDVHEMLGMVKGVVCDGLLNEDEITAFAAWLTAHPDATGDYPGKQLAQRIISIFADGRIDKVERNELYEMFCDTVGAGEEAVARDYSAQLPLDVPPPDVVFNGRTFVFTGGCVWGSRSLCEKAVVDRGGRCNSSIRANEPTTLVIGILGNRAWIQSNHGRKIEYAVELRSQAHDVKIISESHWAAALAVPLRIVS
jgi:NAD-dependent DNA ligase